MHASPGEELAPGVYDMTWRLYETKPEGIVSVEGQIASDWTYERVDFVWGEDLQDYCGLHGITAYVRTNMPSPCAGVRMGRHILAGDFILCGQLFGETVPFHTEAKAREIISWFVTKQEQWDAIYSEQAYGEAQEGSEAAPAGAGSGTTQRRSRPRLH